MKAVLMILSGLFTIVGLLAQIPYVREAMVIIALLGLCAYAVYYSAVNRHRGEWILTVYCAAASSLALIAMIAMVQTIVAQEGFLTAALLFSQLAAGFGAIKLLSMRRASTFNDIRR